MPPVHSISSHFISSNPYGQQIIPKNTFSQQRIHTDVICVVWGLNNECSYVPVILLPSSGGLLGPLTGFTEWCMFKIHHNNVCRHAECCQDKLIQFSYHGLWWRVRNNSPHVRCDVVNIVKHNNRDRDGWYCVNASVFKSTDF